VCVFLPVCLSVCLSVERVWQHAFVYRKLLTPQELKEQMQARFDRMSASAEPLRVESDVHVDESDDFIDRSVGGAAAAAAASVPALLPVMPHHIQLKSYYTFRTGLSPLDVLAIVNVLIKQQSSTKMAPLVDKASYRVIADVMTEQGAVELAVQLYQDSADARAVVVSCQRLAGDMFAFRDIYGVLRNALTHQAKFESHVLSVPVDV
jgi:hypothetical protein